MFFMSITKDTVRHLAKLARLEVSEEEVTKLEGELGSILEYIGQIDKALTDEEIQIFHAVKNARREDKVTNSGGAYTADLIAVAPDSQDGFVKVKKII